MPFDVSSEPPAGLYVRHHGCLTDADLVQFTQSTHAGSSFTTLRYIIHDTRACTGAAYSASKVEEVVATDMAAALSNARIKLAVVAVHPDVVAMARSYMDSPLVAYPIRLFESAEAARRWAVAPLSAAG